MSDSADRDAISLSITLPASPVEIYATWLSSAGHSAMTGCTAEISDEVGARFRCWGGYIQGQNQQLEPALRIVQSWRSKDFPEGAEDSQLEIVLLAVPEGTHLQLSHRNIPPGQGAHYFSGWQERYFTPMAKHFTRSAS